VLCQDAWSKTAEDNTLVENNKYSHRFIPYVGLVRRISTGPGRQFAVLYE
jgi:hypothetical protein